MNQIHIDKTRQAHEPDRGCDDTHCYACGIDEIGPGYITCGECFHTYRTPRELRALYRRQLIRAHLKRPPNIFDLPEPSLLEILWGALTIRAKNINFCQHCIHDF